MDPFKEFQLTVENIVTNMKLADYRIGTVTNLNPLIIDLGDNKKIEDVGTNFYYTEQVLKKVIHLQHEHSIDSLSHNHSSGEGATTTNLDGSYNTDKRLASYVVNEGLKLNDKLIMLCVAKGQKFIILSKLYNTNSLVIKPIL